MPSVNEGRVSAAFLFKKGAVDEEERSTLGSD